MNKSGWLLIIGLASLCGVAATGVSWWSGLTSQAQAQAIGFLMMFWFCCGGPLAGAAVFWQVDKFRRRGGRRSSLRSEEL